MRFSFFYYFLKIRINNSEEWLCLHSTVAGPPRLDNWTLEMYI